MLKMFSTAEDVAKDPTHDGIPHRTGHPPIY